jgi:Mg2+ and Co2+ transporter CorA
MPGPEQPSQPSGLAGPSQPIYHWIQEIDTGTFEGGTMGTIRLVMDGPGQNAPLRERGIPAELRPYFSDVEDHASHVLAEMDTYRDLLSAALDVSVFYSFNRLGHVMKRLTAVTVIIMVPNFVASIYGMNFDRIFPPSAGQWSFFIVVAGLMVMVAWGFIHSKLLKWL